jgi:hypothetical protein
VDAYSGVSVTLPLTEDFSNDWLKDASRTSANWSTEEQEVALQWRNRLGSGKVGLPASGTLVGSSDFNVTYDLAVGDVDGDGDLDVVAGIDGPNRLYLNDGDSAPFDSIVNGDIIGSGDSDRTFAVELADMDGDGDLDLVAGNDTDLRNRLYLNNGGSTPFDGIVNGLVIGSSAYNSTISLAVGDVDGDGDRDIVVGNFDWNRLYLNNGSNNPFSGIANGAVIGSAEFDWSYDVELGDLNGNGKLDLVVGNYFGANRLFLNNGSASPFTGTANGAILGSAETDPTVDIALGDVDGDGDLDVVAGNYSGTRTKYYVNDGDSNPFNGISSGIEIGPSDSDSTLYVGLGDLDGDGDLDLVSGNSGVNRFYLNDGDANPWDSVASGTVIDAGSSGSTWALPMADLDGDSDLDLVVPSDGLGNRLFLNDTSFTLMSSAVVWESIGDADAEGTYDITVGDVDHDGDLDVVAGNDGANRLYLNEGDGDPFSGIVSGIAIGTSDFDFTLAVSLADVNGDGNLDLIAGNYINTVNRLYLGNGTSNPFAGIVNGTVIGSSDFGTTQSVDVGDVDGDGDLDVIFGNDGVNRLYLNNGSSTPFSGIVNGAPVGSLDTDTTFEIRFGDLDSDGDLDVVAGNYFSQNRTYMNDGDLAPFDTITYGTPLGSSEADATVGVALGDLNGDGHLDVIVANNISQQNKYYLNDGDSDPFSGLSSGTVFGTTDYDTSYTVDLGDVDQDGDLDVIVGNDGSNKLYLSDGDNSPFSGSLTGLVLGSGSVTQTWTALFVDLDRDGELDILTGENFSVNRLYINDVETVSFHPAPTGTPAGAADSFASQAVAVGDVNGDGHLDLVTANFNQRNRLYLNDGDGDPFDTVPGGTAIGSADTNDSLSIALADIDNDGRLDVVVGNDGFNKWYSNDGSGDPFDTVPNGALIGSSNNDNTLSIALADVDGNGHIDVVAGNNGYNKLYLNDGVGDPFNLAVNGAIIGASDSELTYSVAVGDLDGDGDLDVVAGNSGQPNRYYLNDGITAPFDTITTGTRIGLWDSEFTFSIGLGDLDQDGHLDVVVGNFGQVNRAYMNDGDGAPFDNISNGDSVGSADQNATWSIEIVDANGDGRLDVLAGNFGQVNKSYINDGDSVPFDSATTGGSIGLDTGLTAGIASGDFNQDGDLDVVSGNSGEVNTLHLNRSYNTSANRVVSTDVNGPVTDIARATLSASYDANSASTRNTDITFYLTNNGGAQWHRVESGVPFDFPTYGDDVRWKAELHSLSPMITPTMTLVEIEEILVPFNAGTGGNLQDLFLSLDTNTSGGLSMAEAGISGLAEMKTYDTDLDGEVTMAELLALSTGPVGVASPVWAAFKYNGTELGTSSMPFDTLFEAVSFVAIGGIIRAKGGNSYEVMTIDKPMTIICPGETVRVGALP